jgi:hypothetical protein
VGLYRIRGSLELGIQILGGAGDLARIRRDL